VTQDDVAWAFADAWVLTAVAISRRPCSLPELVAAADGLNHALLLDAEVESALAKLLGSGLLHEPSDLEFDLTEDASALVARRRGGLFAQVDAVLSLLSSVPAHRVDFRLPPGVIDQAMAAYLARSREH
jgi:hypothetical protein